MVSAVFDPGQAITILTTLPLPQPGTPSGGSMYGHGQASGQAVDGQCNILL